MGVMSQLWQTKSRLGYRWWRFKRAVRSHLSTVNETPVIVLGNQKSGTTAIAALLAERAGLSATLDLEEMTDEDERQMHRRDDGLAAFVSSHKLEFSREVIKEPRLTFLYPKVRGRFPEAQFVFIVRDPRENIRSILDRLNLPGDREQLPDQHRAEVDPVWELVLDGHWMGLSGENYVDRLAARWSRAARTYLDNAGAFSLVRYEDFLDDKEAVITQLVERLGLPAVNDIHDKVDAQYQPRGNRSVGWKAFYSESNLTRIESRCASAMKELGYAPGLRDASQVR